MDKVYHFSAPGRTEIGGNHTDHQHGCVLAAAVDMETTAEVRLNGTNTIRVDSEGYKPVEIDLNDLAAKETEKNTTAALIRGVAAAFAQRGYKLVGFDAKVRSTVLPGSGLSSSAAFEVLIGRILNGLFANNAVSAIEIAQIGQYAENVYFGKPSRWHPALAAWFLLILRPQHSRPLRRAIMILRTAAIRSASSTPARITPT